MVQMIKKTYIAVIVYCLSWFFTGIVFAGISLIQSFEEGNITGDTHFGYSVSGAVDVNNDNYDDVIVGAYWYSSATGRVYIYYGGSSMDNTADVIMTGETTSNAFGSSVSGAGDVNNDGYDDVIVGAWLYNSFYGRAYVYYGGSSMDNTADINMTGEGINNDFGYSVSGAGDVNNDGYDDVIVGASEYNLQTGRAYVYYGGYSMDNTADVTMTGVTTSNKFGNSVSGAGDVNNDGYDDVIVGAESYSSAYLFYGGFSMDNIADVTMTDGYYLGCSVSCAGDVNNDDYDDVIVGAYGYYYSTGRAYIYYGSSSMDNTADVTMTGGAANNYFGNSVSGAGDVNNDGYDDVIVGTQKYSHWNGRAYVFYGGYSMDNAADVTMTGEKTSNKFGHSVSDAGDVNNDGYVDVIVGADGYNSETGRVYLYYGGSSMDNTVDVTMTGEETYSNFGCSISGAGDVNNDGYDDVIIGTEDYNHAYVFYGGSSMDNTVDVTMTGSSYFGCSVSGAGDVNNDGYDDVTVGEHGYNSNTGRAYIYYGGPSMDNIEDVTMTGETTGDYFGISVSCAGDVNKDDYDDMIVGASGYSSSIGRAYIYYGGSSMDSTADVTMTGEGTYGDFGRSVSTAGDVNKDDYDDVIVGAYYYNGSTGRAYVFYGGSSMDNSADVTMTGESSINWFGISVSTAGDVDNDGYDDVIIGAYGYSSSTGRAYVYYGGSSMDNNADVTITGETTGDQFGYSVSTAGDVNGDGSDEIIVGAHTYGPLYYNGKGYIYTGYGEYQDIEAVNSPGSYQFNETGDGRHIDMNFGSLSGSGYVIVDQTNLPPSNAPCTDVCELYWGITHDVGITGFSADLTFHYNEPNVSGFIESEAYLGIAKFNSSTNTWIWLGGTVDGGTNTVTVPGVTSFSTFALYRRIFGDSSGDGYVDAADLQNLGDCWHETNSGEFSAGTNARFFNTNKNTDAGDQIIDAADLQVFGDCWHNGIP